MPERGELIQTEARQIMVSRGLAVEIDRVAARCFIGRERGEIVYARVHHDRVEFDIPE